MRIPGVFVTTSKAVLVLPPIHGWAGEHSGAPVLLGGLAADDHPDCLGGRRGCQEPPGIIVSNKSGVKGGDFLPGMVFVTPRGLSRLHEWLPMNLHKALMYNDFLFELKTSQ